MIVFDKHVGRVRLGGRPAKASVASRSRAATKANGAAAGSRHAAAPLLESYRTHASHVRFPHFANQQGAKIKGCLIIGRRFHSNPVTDKSFADKSLAPAPSNFAVASDSSLDDTTPVAQAHAPRRLGFGTVNLRWRSLLQSFVRTLVVVLSNPAIGPLLLRLQMPRSGAGDFRFKNPMHLFVRPVLFRMSGGDELHSNPQCCPPSTQARQARCSGGAERAAVIHSNDRWISITPKQLQKDTARRFPLLLSQQTDDQQMPAEQISHCQWVHSLAVSRSKPSFEIYRPYVVAPDWLRQGSPWQSR